MGEEEVDAHESEDADEVSPNSAAECRDLEEVHIDQRRFQSELSPNEYVAGEYPDCQITERVRIVEAVDGDVLNTRDRSEHSDHGQNHDDEVDRPWVRVLTFP